MRETLLGIAKQIASAHDAILQLNDRFSLALTDKHLHFLVMGLAAMALFVVVECLFHLLARKRVTIIAMLYVLTVMFVVTVAVEIGQEVTGTGVMEWADVTWGMYGSGAGILADILLRGIGWVFFGGWRER